ncbi:MAG: hypothetical protein J0M08_09930 [Bacteroidetes bacterium]|nr:hypothetical protein [Bacteroidota bacterium]
MKRKNYILLVITSFLSFVLVSQPKVNCDGDTVNYVSLGTSEYGIGFGNPSNYNGLRVTGIDKNCNTNGMAMNLFTETTTRKTNGIDIGLSQFAENVNGFSFGLLSNSVSNRLQGVSIGLFLSEVYRLYGVGFTLGFQESDKIHGVSLSGASTVTFEGKGVLISAFRVVADSFIHGIALAPAYTKTSQNIGLQLSAINISGETRGAQVGLINKTEYLSGVQFGLINIVKERKHFRYMPFVNFGGKKRPKEMNKSITVDMASRADCGSGFIDFNATTTRVNEKGEAISLSTELIDTLTIVIDHDINYKDFEIYVGNQLVDFTTSSRSTMTGKLAQLKKPEYASVRIKSKKTNRCLTTTWKPNYNTLRILTDDDPTNYLQLNYSNTNY